VISPSRPPPLFLLQATEAGRGGLGTRLAVPITLHCTCVLSLLVTTVLLSINHTLYTSYN